MARRSSFVLAERELEWYFACAGEVMGLHAGNLEPGGGTLWDASTLERLHLSRLRWEHRRQVEQACGIDQALSAVGTEPHAVLIAAFTSRPWDSALRTASGQVGENGTLAGLVVTSPEARAFFEERRKRAPRDLTELCRHLADFARTEARGKVFRPLVEAARKRLDGALGVYTEARRNQTSERKAKTREAIALLRAGLG